MDLKVIDGDRLHSLMDFPSLVAGLEKAHAEDTDVLEDLLLEQPDESGTPTHFFLRAAWQNRKAAGVKLITIFPENLTSGSGLPSIQAVYVLFDGKDGSPVACLDGTVLTWRKTAADSALGAKYLAREDARTMLMVGAGAMAPHLIQAHHAVRPGIDRVVIWNRTAERGRALAAGLALPGAAVSATEDLEGAAREADVICTATMPTEPVVRGAWLKPGAHLDLVGAFTKDAREADDEAVRRGRVYVDSRLTTIGHVGDITIPLETGVLAEDDIVADLYQLCRGERRGRESADEITVFKNGGGGHLDLMCARYALARAEEADA
jgi:ornithine cyclodeaminase